MKKIKKTLFAVCAAGAAACAAVAAEKPVVVPAPVKMAVTGGECSAKAEPKFVTVSSIPPEGYELSVKKDGVTIRSSGAAGAFYAKMTLAQLKSPGKKTIPCVEIKDARTFCYLDYGQGLEDDPFQYIGGKVTLEKSYAFDPCEDIPEELRGHILGGQGNNWSEYTWNECDLDWKMWPRACAIAEAVWTGDKKPGFADFMRRMKTHRKRLVSQGVNCAPLR